MKTQLSLALVCALVLVTSATCDNLDNISVESSGETTIEGSLLGDLLGQLSFVGFEGIDISQSQAFQDSGYTKEQIDSVYVTQFRLTVTAPEDGNFDFLTRISFSVEADGLPPIELARLDPIPEGSTELELELLGVDLRDYAVADTMVITTSATGLSPSEDTTINATVVLDVDVNVDGVLGCSASGR